MPEKRWKVYRARRKDGSLYRAVIWSVDRPDGTWEGDFATWSEAMEWATSIGTRVEFWLERQP